ncbi:hypothetical protein GS485_09455 [Rhodococcus hoagii]|nr:hypothetical protein [Prescottella equi]NKR69320.1 hypothetical protein [Prescottella equi]NKT04969.1 hypothetical protein [Prescottella equi]
MRKFLPYFSTRRGAARVYHNFLDCPAGKRITRADREPGVGPDGLAYPQCEQCAAWDDKIAQSRSALHRWLESE